VSRDTKIWLEFFVWIFVFATLSAFITALGKVFGWGWLSSSAEYGEVLALSAFLTLKGQIARSTDVPSSSGSRDNLDNKTPEPSGKKAPR